jgi:hypothetical protein
MKLLTKKLSLILALVLILLSFLAYESPYGLAQGGTKVSGFITSNSTWTKAGSPYTLIGPVAVNQGVTLTTEAGTTIYLSVYNMEINGILQANQIDVEPKLSSVSNITFTSISSGWNEQTGSGSIIENSNLGTVYIQSASPKIIASTIYSLIINGGQPTVTGNNIVYDYRNSIDVASLIIQNGEPLIYNNSIGLAEISGGSPIISQNTFGPLTTISAYIFGGSPTVINNTVNGEIDVDAGSPTITNNMIDGQILTDQYGRAVYMHDGIRISGGNNTLIDNNSILDDFSIGIQIITGKPTIQRNLIEVNGNGIEIDSSTTEQNNASTSGGPTIQNNTIALCYDGILTSTPQFSLIYNNIENNSDYNVNFEATGNFNSTFNWWGTTNQQAINQTIYDSKYNFNVGTVTFIPFLTAPNSQASALNVSPTSSTYPTSPSMTPTATPKVPELSWCVFLPLLLSVFSVAVILRHRKTANPGYRGTAQ